MLPQPGALKTQATRPCVYYFCPIPSCQCPLPRGNSERSLSNSLLPSTQIYSPGGFGKRGPVGAAQEGAWAVVISLPEVNDKNPTCIPRLAVAPHTHPRMVPQGARPESTELILWRRKPANPSNYTYLHLLFAFCPKKIIKVWMV